MVYLDDLLLGLKKLDIACYWEGYTIIYFVGAFCNADIMLPFWHHPRQLFALCCFTASSSPGTCPATIKFYGVRPAHVH